MLTKAYYDYLKEHGWHDDFDHPFGCLASAYQYETVYKVVRRYDLGGDVLDWGCGYGHFSRYLTAHGIPTVGYSFLDPPKSLQNEPLFHYVRGDSSDPVGLPFDSERFSTVFSIGVLEHVGETGGNDKGSMKEIWRVLRPGGLFICAHLPNLHGWIERFGRAIGKIDYFHRWKYTADDIRALAREAGFRVEEIGRYNFLPRNSLRKLPSVLKDTALGAGLINAVDSALTACAPRYTQNYYFCARKVA